MSLSDKIKKKIFQIYENFGLDPDELTDEEISRLVEYYSDKQKKLDQDLKDSKSTDSGEKNGK